MSDASSSSSSAAAATVAAAAAATAAAAASGSRSGSTGSASSLKGEPQAQAASQPHPAVQPVCIVPAVYRGRAKMSNVSSGLLKNAAKRQETLEQAIGSASGQELSQPAVVAIYSDRLEIVATSAQGSRCVVGFRKAEIFLCSHGTREPAFFCLLRRDPESQSQLFAEVFQSSSPQQAKACVMAVGRSFTQTTATVPGDPLVSSTNSSQNGSAPQSTSTAQPPAYPPPPPPPSAPPTGPTAPPASLSIPTSAASSAQNPPTTPINPPTTPLFPPMPDDGKEGAEDNRRTSLMAQTLELATPTTSVPASGFLPTLPDGEPLADLHYLGFCELATYEDYALTFAAELHTRLASNAKAVEAYLTNSEVIFIDATTKRELRKFTLVSLNVVGAVAVPAPDSAPCLCLVRKRDETDRTFVHIFAAAGAEAVARSIHGRMGRAHADFREAQRRAELLNMIAELPPNEALKKLEAEVEELTEAQRETLRTQFIAAVNDGHIERGSDTEVQLLVKLLGNAAREVVRSRRAGAPSPANLLEVKTGGTNAADANGGNSLAVNGNEDAVSRISERSERARSVGTYKRFLSSSLENLLGGSRKDRKAKKAGDTLGGENSAINTPSPRLTPEVPDTKEEPNRAWRQEMFQMVNKHAPRTSTPGVHRPKPRRRSSLQPLPQEVSRPDFVRARWKRAMHQALLYDRQRRLVAERAQEQKQAHDSMRCAAWETLLADVTEPNTAALREALNKGLPEEMRCTVWKAFSKRWPEAGPTSHYLDLLVEPCIYLHAIQIDISRTFPTHPMFRDKSAQMALFNCLKAYSILDEDVGYCQGMSFIMALFLLHTTEEDAFDLFRTFMYAMGFREQYLPDMLRLKQQLYQLTRLLHERQSTVYQHFSSYGVEPFLYATPWFLALFSTQFPPEFAARVMDHVLLEGMPFVFKVILSLFRVDEAALLQLTSFEAILNHLQTQLPQLSLERADEVLLQASNLDISLELLERLGLEFQALQDSTRAPSEAVEDEEDGVKKIAQLRLALLDREATVHELRREVDAYRQQVNHAKSALQTLRNDVVHATKDAESYKRQAEHCRQVSLKLLAKLEAAGLASDLPPEDELALLVDTRLPGGSQKEEASHEFASPERRSILLSSPRNGAPGGSSGRGGGAAGSGSPKNVGGGLSAPAAAERMASPRSQHVKPSNLLKSIDVEEDE